MYTVIQGHLNINIGPRTKQCSGAHTYTTTHSNKTVNVDKIDHDNTLDMWHWCYCSTINGNNSIELSQSDHALIFLLVAGKETLAISTGNILLRTKYPDEGYFERTWWRLFLAYLMKLFWAYLMKVILSIPDEGYVTMTTLFESENRLKTSQGSVRSCMSMTDWLVV
jgi:hypothetical protein